MTDTDTLPSVVVFDIGGVLIDWNPRHLYRKLFAGDEDAMEHFLATVCTAEWNLQQDAGRSWADGVAERIAAFPQYADLITAFDQRWIETVRDRIPGTRALLSGLIERKVPVYSITNFSREKFPLAQARFPELTQFAGVIVSAHEHLIKPDPKIYRLLLDRYNLRAEQCLFIDDIAKNVDGARAVGMHAVQFTSAAALDSVLHDFRLL